MRSTLILTSDEPLCRHTRIGTGGPAALLAEAHTAADAHTALLLCRDRGLPLMVLGKGSNVLMPDEGLQGAVLKLDGELKQIEINHQAGTVSAGGGCALMHLGLQLARRGFAGCTYMGVIPGSVGGAVRMNAGVDSEQCIAKDFMRAELLDMFTGETKTVETVDMGFSYRSSCLADQPWIVLRAVFRLPPETVSADSAVRRLQARLRQRCAQQPRGFRTFGSTFKNPPAPLHPAGWYLEQAGMKGLRTGGAMVAAEHANWIVNTGNATTRDIVHLMDSAKKRVLERFGVRLMEEVVIVSSCPD